MSRVPSISHCLIQTLACLPRKAEGIEIEIRCRTKEPDLEKYQRTVRIVMQIRMPPSVHQKMLKRQVFTIALVPSATIEELTQIVLFEDNSGYCNRSLHRRNDRKCLVR